MSQDFKIALLYEFDEWFHGSVLPKHTYVLLWRMIKVPEASLSWRNSLERQFQCLRREFTCSWRPRIRSIRVHSDYAQAQQYLANAIQVASTKVNRYYWRVSGNEANSLCRILLLGEEELKVLLRHCRIYQGANDNFSKNHFELLMLACKCEYTSYVLHGWPKLVLYN